MTNIEQPLKKARRVESEDEKDNQQLKQESDMAAILQDELIQAADREIQLQMQLYKTKDGLTQLQMWLEQRSKVFDDYKREQKMKQRDSRFTIGFNDITYILLFTQLLLLSLRRRASS